MELNWLSVLGIALGLAMDALAVSIAAGLTIDSVTPRHVFRVAFHFGLFQFVMPIVGWLAGEQLADRVHGYDQWLAFVLLACVGGKMLWEALRQEQGKQPRSHARATWCALAGHEPRRPGGRIEYGFPGGFDVASQRGHRNCHGHINPSRTCASTYPWLDSRPSKP